MNKLVRLSIVAAAMLAGLSSTAMAQQPQAPNMTFFVTSIGPGKGGDLGGLAGADAYCQRLATAAGAGAKTWRAYLSTSGNAQGGPTNARDRIGNGPWQNFKGTVIATSVADLHSDNNKLGQANSLTERGNVISGVGSTPNWHDALTGSDMEGNAWPGNMGLTCNNWTSSTFGSAMLGHIDRRGGADTVFQRSWNATHMSRSCSAPDLVATGGNGLFYCFAQ
ncbi:MAG TPA: lectin [Xanthobacteraceae bacterium]|jgi:hypothetical protein|nr:lectin [Xanthobacteraceae bacterium]